MDLLYGIRNLAEVFSFWYNSSTLQTDRQTAGQTFRSWLRPPGMDAVW